MYREIIWISRLHSLHMSLQHHVSAHFHENLLFHQKICLWFLELSSPYVKICKLDFMSSNKETPLNQIRTICINEPVRLITVCVLQSHIGTKFSSLFAPISIGTFAIQTGIITYHPWQGYQQNDPARKSSRNALVPFLLTKRQGLHPLLTFS
jgi:hypothetical protein